jgi:hypothetical protein
MTQEADVAKRRAALDALAEQASIHAELDESIGPLWVPLRALLDGLNR